MNCPHELMNFIIRYLKNRKCYIEMKYVPSSIFGIEKSVPRGSCLGPILFLLFHYKMAQRIPSVTHSDLFADDLALITRASAWWHRTEFAPQIQWTCQKALNEAQSYAVEWKQPINFSKIEWQRIHRRVVIPTLSLTTGQHCIKRMCSKRSKRTLQPWNALLDRKKSSEKARRLISRAFIQPYLQMIYVVWSLSSISSIEKNEAINRQLCRLIHNWWDVSDDGVRWLPNWQTAESKAQRFLRRFSR